MLSVNVNDIFLRTHLVCMRTNVVVGLKQVRIIEVPDKRDPDSRGCTVPAVERQFLEVIPEGE